MKWRNISYLCGSILLYLSFAMLVPLLLGMWDRDSTRVAFSISVILTIMSAWLLIFWGETSARLTIRECLAFVTFAWGLSSVFCALPFLLSGSVAGMTEAFFEAASGLTTTGATIYPDVESLPRALLLWRAELHWLGGMGIVVLFIAVFPRLGTNAGHLLQAEAPGPITTAAAGHIVQTAKILWLIYIALTAGQTVLLNMAGLSFFDSVTHAFATMATGGFSTKNASIAGFANPAVEWIIIIFMLLAGGNFILYYYLLCGQIKKVWQDFELRFYLGIILSAAAIITLFLLPSGREAAVLIRQALFQVVSLVTTTGFTNLDFSLWPYFVQTILFLLMFTGGCGGSTGGGIKQIRLIVLGKYLVREMKKVTQPRLTYPVALNEVSLSAGMINRILSFIFLYLALFAVSVLYLTSLGYDAVTSFSAAASAQGNIGPGFALVGPSQTYQTLADGAKIWLACLMIVGRLEIFTVFAFLLPQSSMRTWMTGRRRPKHF